MTRGNVTQRLALAVRGRDRRAALRLRRAASPRTSSATTAMHLLPAFFMTSATTTYLETGDVPAFKGEVS